MNLDARRQHIRTAFIAVAALGILLNVIFGFTAYKQNEKSDYFGELVVRSYESERHLRLLSEKIRESQPLAALQEELILLKQTLDTPLEKIEQGILSNPHQVSSILTEMTNQEEKVLRERIAQDLRQNQSVESSLIRTLYWDGLLVILLLGLFLYLVYTRRLIENKLKESINSMRGTVLKLEEENFRQKALMKTTVHDLKNPIGSIVGFAEILKEHAESQESVIEFSDMIRRISKSSLSIVENLLTDESSLPLTTETMDLLPIMSDICSQLEVQAQMKGQILIKEFSLTTAPIHANLLKMEELVSNLVGNAIKYSPQSEKIFIRCFEVRGRCRVEVEDRGPGFSAEDKIKAFQYGQKLSARPTNNESSSGLGLFTVKQIVELFNGSIEILDNHIRGACVAFELPLIQSATKASDERPHPI